MNVEDGDRGPLFPQRVERLRASGSLTRREADALEERGDRRSEVRVRVRDQDPAAVVHLWCSSPSAEGGPPVSIAKLTFSQLSRTVRRSGRTTDAAVQDSSPALYSARSASGRLSTAGELRLPRRNPPVLALQGEEGCGRTCSRDEATVASSTDTELSVE